MLVKTNRLLIRPLDANDLSDIYEYCSQKEIGEDAGWAPHTSMEQSGEILNAWIAAGRKHAIVLLDSGKVVGHISIDPDSEEGRADTRELGCALNSKYHRHGIMSEALPATISHLFAQEGVEIIWACCFQHNLASKGMIEKCGFQFVKEGNFYSASLGREFPSCEYRIIKSN